MNFWSRLYFLKSEILDCRTVALGKQVFFGVFEILEDPFLSKHFQNVSAVQSLVWYRL